MNRDNLTLPPRRIPQTTRVIAPAQESHVKGRQRHGTACLGGRYLRGDASTAMHVLENLKKTLGKVTGVGKPSGSAARRAVRRSKPHAIMFRDDGSIPNNARLPFLLYRGAVGLTGSADPAAILEELFNANDWGDSWRKGIYEYVHYHSRTHEVLGIARGHARVRFGGNEGKIIALRSGDVVILPAGTGHQHISASKNLMHALARAPRARLEIDPEGADTGERPRLRQGRAAPGVVAAIVTPRTAARSGHQPASVLGLQRRLFCSQPSTRRAMSRLFFSIITMWPLPKIPLSCSRIYSVLTPAWLRYLAVQWSYT